MTVFASRDAADVYRRPFHDIGVLSISRPLKNVASEEETRKNEVGSVHGVHEHYEPNFDAVSSSAVVFQRPVRGDWQPLHLPSIAGQLPDRVSLSRRWNILCRTNIIRARWFCNGLLRKVTQ